jgi:hypothetical protein
MKMTPFARFNVSVKRREIRSRLSHRALALFCFAAFMAVFALSMRAQAPAPTAWNVTIVLPRKLVAGQPATLATFGVDGKLAPGVTVDLGGEEHVLTDKTGRGYFNAPTAGNILIAKASGSSAAALVDPASPASDANASEANHQAISVAPFVSMRDAFAICGPGLRGDANDNRVQINGEESLIVAASPECMAVLPGPKAVPGPAKISVESPGTGWTVATTLVSLEFEAPNPPLIPEKKSELVVRVHGSDQRLRIIAVNETPGVLRFLRGDAQELVTSGGAANFAALKVQAIRSGDYSFHARLVPAPDADAARRFLEAAQPLAEKDLQPVIKRLAKQLARQLTHHSRDWEKIKDELDRIAAQTIAGDFRTLLDAARSAL